MGVYERQEGSIKLALDVGKGAVDNREIHNSRG